MKPTAYEQFTRLEREHWWFRGRRAVYLGLLKEALGDSKPERVLDVGAGVGGFLAELSEIGEQVIYTELDRGAALEATARGFKDGLQATAERLPLADGSVDLVCLFDVLEHLEADECALAEITRVLRPGGKLILSVPAHPWLFSRNDEVSGHVRRYSRAELARKIQGSDLHVSRLTYANSLLFPGILGLVLASRMAEACAPRLRHSEHTNLSWKVPELLQEPLYRTFCAELSVSRKWNLPLGHSLLAIAEKRVVGATPIAQAHRSQALGDLRPSAQALAGCPSAGL